MAVVLAQMELVPVVRAALPVEARDRDRELRQLPAMIAVYRASVAMLVILAIGVLLITYVPWLTTALLPLVAGR